MLIDGDNQVVGNLILLFVLGDQNAVFMMRLLCIYENIEWCF